ncbi:hypothetical protein NKH18_20290 [Streptomyces sp. M10(2022)]
MVRTPAVPTPAVRTPGHRHRGTDTGGTDAGATTGGSGEGKTDFPGKEVAVNFACKSPGPAEIVSKVTINAKKKGGDYDLTVKTAKGVMDSPQRSPPVR